MTLAHECVCQYRSLTSHSYFIWLCMLSCTENGVVAAPNIAFRKSEVRSNLRQWQCPGMQRKRRVVVLRGRCVFTKRDPAALLSFSWPSESPRDFREQASHLSVDSLTHPNLPIEALVGLHPEKAGDACSSDITFDQGA